jgi:pimeloyl-ACP methyl ester carboxylesterase/alkylhydroperoxidase family enzyme
MGGCIESWDLISAELARTNTVIRYDQRSAGQSEKVASPFSLDDLATDLEELIDALCLPRPVHLVGAAVGAAQAMLYAAKRPESVASVALLAPAADISQASKGVLEERAHKAIDEGIRSVLSASLDRAWPAGRRLDAVYFRKFRGRYLANDPRAFAQHNHALAGISLGDTARRVACPALVIAGLHDTVRPPASMQDFTAELNSGQFATVDSAHFMAAETPAAVLAKLQTFYAAISRDESVDSRRHTDIPDHELTSNQRVAITEATRGARGHVPAPMRAWLASPEFARRAQSLGETLRYHTSLDPRLSELAILATACLWRSDYEWRVHAVTAANAGLPAEAIESIRTGVRPHLLSEEEELVLDVSLAVHQDKHIGDDLFDRATAVLGRVGMVELVGILGYYSLVSMTLNVYQIDSPDAETSPFDLASERRGQDAEN